MGKPDLGVKQTCPNCDARFFDLNKRPAYCPKCGTSFDPDSVKPSRRAAAAAALAPEPEEAEETEEAEAEAEIPPVDSPAAAEVIVEGEETDDEPVDEPEEEANIVEEEVEEEEEEAEAINGEAGDVPFLEDDDEEFESDEFEEGEEEEDV